MKISDKRSANRDYAEPNFNFQKTISSDGYDADDLYGKNKENAEADIIKETMNYCNNWLAVDDNNIQKFKEDVNFLYADQWSQNLRAIRSQKKKTIMTYNYLKSYVDVLMGEEIKNDPDPVVEADNSNVSQEDVTLRAGILRQAFYENNMPMVKKTTYQYMLAGGYNVIETGFDYKNAHTWDKKLTAFPVDDPTIYFFDARAKMPDKSDGMICGKTIQLTDQEYDLYFPDAKCRDSVNFNYTSDDFSYKGFEGNCVKILQIYRKEEYEETICLLSNGESLPKEEAEEHIRQQDKLLRKIAEAEKLGAQVPMEFKKKIEIIRERKSICHRIMHYKMNRSEILEWGEWPSQYLPYVYVPCYSVRTDGVLRSLSVHRYAQDAQRYVNYLASEAADVLMTSHQKNWLAPTKCFKGKLLDMALSPQNSSPILLYDPGDKGEKPEYVPPPQLSPAFSEQFNRTVGDIANIMGRFEANRGQDGAEPSSLAIDKRAILGNMGSITPADNLLLAIEQVCNIWLDLMPAVFDTQRLITIRGKDGKEKKVMINQEIADGKVNNDMSTKGFKATIKAGVSFEAQKNIGVTQLHALISSDPNLAPLLADKMAELLQVQNMPDIVDRIREFQLGMPLPQIIAKETGMQPAPPPPNPEAIITQKELELKQSHLQNEQNKTALEAQKMIADSIDSHAKNVADMKKIYAQIMATSMKANAEIQKAKMDNHVEMTKHFNPQVNNEKRPFSQKQSA